MPDLDVTSPELTPAPNSELDALLAPPPPRPSLRRLFIGDDGLRAGWSVLLWILILLGLITLARYTQHHFFPTPKPVSDKPLSAPMAPRTMAIGETVAFIIIGTASFLMSLVERRPFARYGLATRRLVPDFLSGLFWGFTALSLLVGMLYLTHGIALNGFALHGTVALLYALKWGLVFFLVGLFEEFLFRGFLQYTVARGVAGITRTMDHTNHHAHLIGFAITASLFSVGFFMLAHLGNGGENFVGIFQVGLAGAVFAFALYRTGTLWWAIGLHTSWDWAQSYFYGTADSGNLAIGHLINSHPLGSRFLSGGPDGPEGSVLGIPTLLLVALVIHLTLPKRDYPLTPDQSPPNTTAIQTPQPPEFFG